MGLWVGCYGDSGSQSLSSPVGKSRGGTGGKGMNPGVHLWVHQEFLLWANSAVCQEFLGGTLGISLDNKCISLFEWVAEAPTKDWSDISSLSCTIDLQASEPGRGMHEKDSMSTNN